MKNIIYILPFLFFSQLNAQSYNLEQKIADFQKLRDVLKQPVPAHIQEYFDIAINEIDQMLKGEKPLSFKRAVYLVENAYYEGKISWEEYNSEILRITPILNKMIDDRNLRQYKTAGNWAVFTYMSDSISENNFKPYQYDFENFMTDTDLESAMVSRLLKTKKGNCRSLPYLYKILANEVNVEAFIALAPMHVYVKHRDEQGNWWNLEMTTGSFSRSSFIMETFNVSEVAIESGLFMKSLSDIESVACCIHDLFCYYERKTGRYSDDFVKKCYEIGLQYYPNSLLQVVKVNDLKFRLDAKMNDMELNDYRGIINYPDLMNEFQMIYSTFQYISQIGYSTIPLEDYEKMVNDVKEKQSKLKLEK
ncbi:MAG: hypothetical protein LBC68_10480 [Prevotellaceae bacterium]|jgi:hypothetical protein|nr:hypothetical protein [Prevotellaceae bacterium]